MTITSPEGITSIAICNLVGQAVYSTECNANSIEINIAALPAGVYFVKVNGAIAGKFVKQ